MTRPKRPPIADVEATQRFHSPPLDAVNQFDYYNDNWTAFGAILRGESPAQVLAETTNSLAFKNIHPLAPLHVLVIPKQFIGSVFDLTVADLPILDEMNQTALKILSEHYPDTILKSDYRLCFHIPPFNSVDHLHLHVLAP